MAETTQTPEAPAPVVVEKSSRIQRFRAEHPRVTRALTLTVGAFGIVVATSAYKNAQMNKDKIAAGLEHAKEAASDLSDSVTAPDTEA